MICQSHIVGEHSNSLLYDEVEQGRRFSYIGPGLTSVPAYANLRCQLRVLLEAIPKPSFSPIFQRLFEVWDKFYLFIEIK